MWTCKKCNEQVDDNFESCWNCQSNKPELVVETIPNTNTSFKCPQCGLINDTIEGTECKRCKTVYDPNAAIQPTNKPLPQKRSSVEHLVVPLASVQNRSDQIGQIVAKQLQDIINTHTQQGWEFYRVDAITYVEAPGCLGFLLGKNSVMGHTDVVIFRRYR